MLMAEGARAQTPAMQVDPVTSTNPIGQSPATTELERKGRKISSPRDEAKKPCGHAQDNFPWKCSPPWKFKKGTVI